MRVTSQMITTNSMNNINRNKINMNTKGDRYSTGQAIQKPSEDPVVAVRTLKYRSQLTKIEQYLSTNIPEALSWMENTEGALTGVNELVKNINTYCNQAVNGHMELTDRDSIVSVLEEYKDQMFDLGNTDYAGRYVFTGYRTDTPLMFKDATSSIGDADWTTYTITENLKYTDITSKTYVVNGADYVEGVTDSDKYAAMAPSLEKANRLQLSYGNIDKVNSVTFTHTKPDGTKDEITVTGTPNAQNYVLKSKSIADYDKIKPEDYATTEDYLAAKEAANPYNAGEDEVVYIEETGELILGTKVMASAVTHSEISVDYDKTEFAKGDIRPEHYFACTTNYYKNGNATPQETIKYTEPGVQNIQYELNSNQNLTVNTLAKDCISTTIGTKLDEIIRAVNDVFDVKDKIAEAEKTLENVPEAEKEAINTYIEQLGTELVLREKVLTEAFSSGLTTTKKAEEDTNVALADLGARYTRAQLIESRQEEQQTTVTKLLTDIFYVDLEDAVIEYKAAQTYYNASLMCASTVVQQSLLDYLR